VNRAVEGTAPTTHLLLSVLREFEAASYSFIDAHPQLFQITPSEKYLRTVNRKG